MDVEHLKAFGAAGMGDRVVLWSASPLLISVSSLCLHYSSKGRALCGDPSQLVPQPYPVPSARLEL